MAVLCDRDIKEHIEQGKIIIENFDMSHIDACSVDLRLGPNFRIFKHNEIPHIDVKKGVPEEYMETIQKGEHESFIVHPGELILAHTIEYVKIPDNLVGTVDGRSSLGRIGLLVHSTANSIDPGFEGQITLEISNIAKVPVLLWPGIKICRLTFTQLTGPCEIPYNKRKKSKYSGQIGPDASKIDLDYQDKLFIE